MKQYLLSVIFSFLICNATAQTLETNPKLVTEIENYLNNITSMEANFIQMNQDTSFSEGVFYLLKPGKFRWEYKDQPITIVANGKSLIYLDKELEQVNYIPIENTIAALLIQKNINLNKDVAISELTTTENAIKITVTQEKQKEIKQLSLIFQRDPFELGKIELIDEQEQKIIITFFDKKINQKKPHKDLFQIKDPRLN